MDLPPFDWLQYWFMFPVSIMVATVAMVSGIGGAALFTPIFLIIFPWLGPDYPLGSAAAAISSALFTQFFGFGSGFVGYLRKGLIDFESARPFIKVGVPAGILGGLLLPVLGGDLLQGAYAVLMVALAVIVIRRRPQPAEELPAGGPPSAGVGANHGRPSRSITATDGTVYRYPMPRQGIGAVATAAGGFVTGLLSVGIGEVVVPQLAKRNRVPLPVAAATSVFVVILVVAATSLIQMMGLIVQGGFRAVPWHLLVYTVPGVIIGGQIGPRLHGTVPQRTMEWIIGGLFILIALSMGWVAVERLLPA